MVERDGLENRCTGFCTVGSNPTLSASSLITLMEEKDEQTKKTFRPSDRYLGFPVDLPFWQRRIFEIIPGLLFWLLFLIPFIFAIFKWNTAYVVYMVFLVSYWFFRAIKFNIGIFMGVKRMEESLATDWIKEIEKLNDSRYEKMRFIYLCPVYGETYDILEPSFEAWANSEIDTKKIDVVMAMEEKKKDLQIENFGKLKKKFGEKFGSMTYFVHPFGIEGEIVGVKGANINFAARNYVKQLEKEGKNLTDYLLITCDSDLRPHPKYLSSVVYSYLTAEEPENSFYTSAIHTFNNNLWSVPSLIRVFSSMTTMAILYSWVIDKSSKSIFRNEEIYTRDTFSSYIVNLNTLKKFEFWDPEIPNDDTAFYWNAMIRSKGTFKGREVYVPTYNDAVENKDFVSTHVSFYKQQYRWGWGKIPFPITLSIILRKGSGISAFKRISMIKTILDQMWLFTIVFVLTFGLMIVSSINPGYKYTVFAYNLPKILSIVFTIAMLTNIWTVFLRRKISPIPKKWKWWRNILDIGETYLISINMLTFNFIPHVQALTEMMLGKGKFKRNFYVTEKVRKEKLPEKN